MKKIIYRILIILAIIIATFVFTGVVAMILSFFASLTTNFSDWFVVLSALFGGSISAFAVYIAFSQANKLHKDTKIYMVREKRYERKLREFKDLEGFITEVLVKTCSLNILDKIDKYPKSEDELLRRKKKIEELYAFFEESFNKLFTNGVFFNHIPNGVNISSEELRFYEKRKSLSDEYRDLYTLIHDFINFSFNTMSVCYQVNGLWIWELDTSNLKEELSKEEFDPDKPWTLMYGVKVNIVVDSSGVPVANEISYKSDLLMGIQPKILEYAKEEQEYYNKFNSIVRSLRVKLVEFLGVAEDFEQGVLMGNLEPSCHIFKKQQIEMFMLEQGMNKE